MGIRLLVLPIVPTVVHASPNLLFSGQHTRESVRHPLPPLANSTVAAHILTDDPKIRMHAALPGARLFSSEHSQQHAATHLAAVPYTVHSVCMQRRVHEHRSRNNSITAKEPVAGVPTAAMHGPRNWIGSRPPRELVDWSPRL